MKITDVIKLIKEGEGEVLEFKSTATGSAADICAFLNTEGGSLLIGVQDDGNIVGAPPKTL